MRTIPNVGTSECHDTLDRYLNRHSIDTSVDTWYTPSISWLSRLIFDRLISVGRHLADYRLTVDRVPIECQPSINRDVDRVLIELSIKGRVLMDTWPWMPLIGEFVLLNKHHYSRRRLNYDDCLISEWIPSCYLKTTLRWQAQMLVIKC